MGEGWQSDNNDVRGEDRVTITEAATLTNVHHNTVRKRVKDGTYQAEKVFTERGPTWMIDRNSLITNTSPSASQRSPSQRQPNVNVQPMEVVQDLLRPFVEALGRVREELGAKRVRRDQAERERDEIAARLAELEAATGGPEDPETVAEEPEGVENPWERSGGPGGSVGSGGDGAGDRAL